MLSATTCPHCRPTGLDNTFISTHSSHSLPNEITYLQAEARRIDDLILRLTAERTGVLRRLNAALSATRVLVPEVLSLIFQSASDVHFAEETMPNNKRRKNGTPIHLVLASICHHWRQVVFSTPYLWTRILAKEIGDNEVGKWEHFLKTSFEKSGGLPLDMVLSRPRLNRVDDEILVSPAVDEVLLRHAGRIRNLALHDFASHAWIQQIPKFAKLKNLVIDFQCIPDSTGTFTPVNLDLPLHAPLHSLILSISYPCSVNMDKASTESLTVLRLYGVPLHFCMKALTVCPELVEFECFPNSGFGQESIPRLSRPVVLGKLEVLDWLFQTGDAQPFNGDLLSYIETPALKTLTWDESLGCEPLPDDTLLPRFLRRLPKTLEILEWRHINDTSVRQCGLIEHVPGDAQLESMTLYECTEAFVRHVLGRLSTCREDGAPPFPRLNYFRLKSMRPSHDIQNPPHFPSFLVHFLEQRVRLTHVADFTLVIETRVYVRPERVFSGSLAQRLMAIVDNGFDFAFKFNDHDVIKLLRQHVSVLSS